MTAPTAARRIELRLNRARLWRWQLELAKHLAADPGTSLAVRLLDGPPVPVAFGLLLAVEVVAFRLSGAHACDRVDEEAFAPWQGRADIDIDLVLDFAPGACAGGGPPCFRVLYDGAPDEDALLMAALSGRSATLAVVDDDGRWLVSGDPAIEDPEVMTRALDTSFSALLQLVAKAVRQGRPPSGTSEPPPQMPHPITPRSIAAFGVRAVSRKLSERLTHLCRQAPSWFVAWRRLDAGAGFADLRLKDYRRMRHDAGRYYADPFPFQAGDRTYVFAEEFPYATGKGLISVAELTAEGLSPARPVLELPVHLSYPHVFAHDGGIYMVPEMLQARSVQLYRAESFPDRWVHEATLLDDIEASDATLCRHRGRWWMFAATRAWWGSNWDTLSVFFADRLQGPWRPHPANPVVIDRRSARPAGQLFQHGDALWRPAQDCSENYGTGLSLCRIDRLDAEAIGQTLLHPIRLRGDGVSRGPHTFNRCGTVEVIDLFGIAT